MFAATAAQAGELNGCVLNRKIELLCLVPEFIDDTPGMDLLGVTTLAAHQKYGGMRMLRMRTRQVGIVSCEAVHKSLLE
jgi:hypothetical protein